MPKFIVYAKIIIKYLKISSETIKILSLLVILVGVTAQGIIFSLHAGWLKVMLLICLFLIVSLMLLPWVMDYEM